MLKEGIENSEQETGFIMDTDGETNGRRRKNDLKIKLSRPESQIERICSHHIHDVNKKLDKKVLMSTGGMIKSAQLANTLGILIQLSEPRSVYHYGWVFGCSDSRAVIVCWALLTFDESRLPITLISDLVKGLSPLTIGLNVKRHSATSNVENYLYISSQRPRTVGHEHI